MVIYMVMRRLQRHPAVPATMSAADFKARCLDLMDNVEQTGRSVIVTKRGRPVAVLAPVRMRSASAYGFMKGRIRILGDIVAPIDVGWDAER